MFQPDKTWWEWELQVVRETWGKGLAGKAPAVVQRFFVGKAANSCLAMNDSTIATNIVRMSDSGLVILVTRTHWTTDSRHFLPFPSFHSAHGGKDSQCSETSQVACLAWSWRGWCCGVAGGGILPNAEFKGFINVVLGSQDISQPAVVGTSWRWCLPESSSLASSAFQQASHPIFLGHVRPWLQPCQRSITSTLQLLWAVSQARASSLGRHFSALRFLACKKIGPLANGPNHDTLSRFVQSLCKACGKVGLFQFLHVSSPQGERSALGNVSWLGSCNRERVLGRQGGGPSIVKVHKLNDSLFIPSFFNSQIIRYVPELFLACKDQPDIPLDEVHSQLYGDFVCQIVIVIVICSKAAANSLPHPDDPAVGVLIAGLVEALRRHNYMVWTQLQPGRICNSVAFTILTPLSASFTNGGLIW